MVDNKDSTKKPAKRSSVVRGKRRPRGRKGGPLGAAAHTHQHDEEQQAPQSIEPVEMVSKAYDYLITYVPTVAFGRKLLRMQQRCLRLADELGGVSFSPRRSEFLFLPLVELGAVPLALFMEIERHVRQTFDDITPVRVQYVEAKVDSGELFLPSPVDRTFIEQLVEAITRFTGGGLISIEIPETSRLSLGYIRPEKLKKPKKGDPKSADADDADQPGGAVQGVPEEVQERFRAACADLLPQPDEIADLQMFLHQEQPAVIKNVYNAILRRR